MTIRFELNNPETFALSNDQWDTISRIIEQDGMCLDYDIVEGDNPHDRHIKVWAHHENTTPTRYWVGEDGNISLVEAVDWNWKD